MFFFSVSRSVGGNVLFFVEEKDEDRGKEEIWVESRRKRLLTSVCFNI